MSDKEIIKLYKDPKFHGSFSGVRTFCDSVFAEKGVKLSIKHVYDVLKTDPLYLMEMKPIRNFPRRSYDVQSYGNLCQMDLCEMKNFQGFRFILVLIDVFSKKMFAVPLKDKTLASVKNGFLNIYEQFSSPIYKIETDRERTFTSNKKLFEDLNIYYNTKGQINKASFAGKRKKYKT